MKVWSVEQHDSSHDALVLMAVAESVEAAKAFVDAAEPDDSRTWKPWTRDSGQSYLYCDWWYIGEFELIDAAFGGTGK